MGSTPMKPNHVWSVLIGLGSTYMVVRFAGFFLESQMHDFHAYYFAAKVAQAGQSPYSLEHLKAASGGLVDLPFLYPPYVLSLFSVFTLSELSLAARLYLMLKAMSLAALVGIWMLMIPREKRLLGLALLLVFVSLGFHESAVRDLRWGNVSTFEQLFLWAGFLSFIRARFYLFSLLIVLASLFKITPIAFLGLLVFVPKRRGWWPMACGLLAFLAIQGLSYATDPAGYQKFLGSASAIGLGDIGLGDALNPSTLTFFRDFFGGSLAEVLYLLTVLIVASLFAYRLSSQRTDWQPLDLLLGATLLFTLASPRMKDYSYMLLIFPTAWFVQSMAAERLQWAWGLALLAIVHFFPYQSLLIALLLFFWWLKGWARRPGVVSVWPEDRRFRGLRAH